MLTRRIITASIGKVSETVIADRGCPQNGVLSPLLWSLVLDHLLSKLE